MKRRKLACLAVSITLLIPMAARAGDTKFSGLAFGDYYWVVADHIDSLEGQNGFWIRRIYFTVDQTISPAWDMRLRLEMNSAGDFSATASNMVPYVKDAYLRWQGGLHSVLAGISPSPTWDVIEEVWGYRSVERTPLDLQRMGAARDFGVSLKGAFNKDKTVRYQAMIGNGNSVGSETDKYKKFLASVGFYPTSKVVIEGYTDYEPRKGRFDRFTLQGFAAYRTDKCRFGVQLARQSRQNGVNAQGLNNDNIVINVASLFAVGTVAPRVTLMGRVDHVFDPNPDAARIAYLPFAPNAKSTLLIGGVDYSPVDNIHLIPNVEIVAYDEPDTDVMARMTFAYQWK